ncbi:uncharacterized protein LOC141596189 [Silene latifolia]|uniref:uncharacterized protein LOC141596189 n=1 Tax=Silene latifolia TaxID=37657 RepID=UPI003D773D2A
MHQHFCLRKNFAILLVLSVCASMMLYGSNGEEYVSAVGDPGMKRDGLRLGLESWNQCNEVGEETPHMGSPRVADCFDLYKASPLKTTGRQKCSLCELMPYAVVHRVTEDDNKLGEGQPFPGGDPRALTNIDLYAPTKELYLASKCEVQDTPNPWHFWMIMLKNGNMDQTTNPCPRNGLRVMAQPNQPSDGFPCFRKGCMNHPSIIHNYTTLQGLNRTTLRGSFYGSWDLDAPFRYGSVGNDNTSAYSVSWEKDVGNGSWVFHHVLKTSEKYPWLMFYLRADATHGFSGGYHYPSRGMLKIIPESPNFKVKFRLEVIKGGGRWSQFYLMDIGSCWKNNGQPCDGNVTSDVTRYNEMILNPSAPSWCNSESLRFCPPYHTFSNGTEVHRNDTDHFPYGAYHIYCAPGNGKYLEEPVSYCDPFSNPQPQEIVQILPHPVWSEYEYPTKQGDGWVGDPRTWELDVGRLSQSLYFYQDPETPPAKRQWTSINIGTEIFKDPNQVAEWTVSNFDVLVPKQ